MTISDTDKLDLLFKHSFGVAKTADTLSKTSANETIASPQAIFDANIWTLASTIPAVAPTTSTDIIAVHVKDKAIKLTADPTAPQNMTWLSSETSLIPGSFGVSYAARVWIGDPSTANAARLYPDTSGEEWLLDGNAGVLLFPNATPASKTVNGTTVTVADNGLYLEAYAYTGPKGFPEAPKGPLETVSLVPGMVAATPLGTLLAGSRIVSIEVDVVTGFDGEVGLEVGNTTVADFYMSASLSDLALPGVYIASPPVPGDDQVVTVTLTGTATLGAATLRLRYA